MASQFALLCLLALQLCSYGDLNISFAPNSLLPDTGINILEDGDTDSCTLFHRNTEILQYMQFRFKANHTESNETVITLTGSNLGCETNLYVTPLRALDAERWTGRWTICQFIMSLDWDNKQMCSFRCSCAEGCEEIQIMKLPAYANATAWQICEIYREPFSSCDVIENEASGIYPIRIVPNGDVRYVNCDMETDGGRWTVLVRRQDGSVDFAREWEDYKLGFGSVAGEFWAGNEFMHQLTTDGQRYALRVYLENYAGESMFAVYDDFWIGAESDNYTLHVTGYSSNSTAGNCLASHDGMMFSCPSRDNDINNENCADDFNACWWYQSCFAATLSGKYGEYPQVPFNLGIIWSDPWGFSNFAKTAIMMVRRTT